MKLLKFAILITSFVSISCFAQDDDVYLKFIKKGSVSVNKAQKEMRRSKKTDVGGLLAKAVILQNNALILYNSKNYTRAVCVSALARRYSALIIESLNKKELHSYLISTDEQTLITHCTSDTELYDESKAVSNEASEADKDYIKSFNNLNVDFN